MPRTQSPLERIASWALIGVVAAVPWIGGAKTRMENVLWYPGVALCSAFFLMCVARARESRKPQIPPLAAGCVGVLLACLAWWWVQPEPGFATAFAEEHWAFIESWNPAGQLQFPREERLFFAGSVLLGFLAAVDLGRDGRFRRKVYWVIAVSGLAAAGYSVGQKWLGWSAVPWLLTSYGLDRFSGPFFNYSASAASVNFAWPWLVFGVWASLKKRLPVMILTVAVTVAALMAWPATSGWGVAGILLTGGALWQLCAKRFGLGPRWILGLCAALFAAAFVWQAREVSALRARYSDRWTGAEATRMNAAARDEAFRVAAASRGDHLVDSPAPPLPSVWNAALRMAGDHPLIGDGPGSWVRESSLYSNDPLVNTFFHMRQFAHHDLLQTAAEWGVLPALAWSALWVFGFYRAAIRNGTSDDDLALLLMLIGVALHSLVHFPLQVPALQTWTAVALGFAWSRRPRVRNEAVPAQENASTNRRRETLG
ncbi:O-antigen ligase family protein [Nibricoccus aquaticus]|uniref:O-antigen ligase family protein n=1 Tax=Nibricoccus aquaticus TaxID=2576891 RepID=UPI0010FCDE19|nr:hypothetical protein [Nibricoccus aquaticus]